MEERSRNVQEAVNYQRVLEHLTFLVRQPEFKVNERTIRRINGLALDHIPKFQNVRGRYKTGRNGVPGRLVGCPPEDTSRLVAGLVSEANEWLAEASTDNVDNHPVVIAAMVMWRLLQIHPFNEGNGRTSRAIATLILMRHGYLGIPTGNTLHPVRSLEWFFDSDRKYYGDCLNRSDQGEHQPWLELFARAVESTMVLIKDKIAEG